MKRDSKYTNLLLGALGVVWGVASTLAFLTLSQIQEDIKHAKTTTKEETESRHALAIIIERSLGKIESLEKRCCEQ